MKYKKIVYIAITVIVYSVLFVSCENVLVPVNENLSTEERLYKDPMFAEGLLMNAYLNIPLRTTSFDEVATDDAVTNLKANEYLSMATGQWSASYNPKGQWNNSTQAIFYLNKFISLIDTVQWKWTNEELNTLYKKRFYGEAFALRGLFGLLLLESTAGISDDGELLGIPIYRQFIENTGNFNIPRLPFKESVDSIEADFNRSLQFLTMNEYKDIQSEDQLPEGYETHSIPAYNEIFGKRLNQRIDGKVVKALKAKLALLAASPAFNLQSDATLWEKAAIYAAETLKGINGLSGLDPDGHRFFQAELIDQINLNNNKDQKEMVWRTLSTVSNSLETRCFPPSQYGNGNVNPTQNFVDVFPTVKGYPINHPLSEYNNNNPYENRDPRLALYVIFNNSVFKGTRINTSLSGDLDGKDVSENSTRTGYYLKKLLREDINLNPVNTTTLNHYTAMIRYTEIFLIYAEAANEAWGPDGKAPNATYSAKDVIAAIRKRAGITQPDNYLASVTDKQTMRELIRNERRIELSFEGFRFWDLRRWKLDLTESAKGINIDEVGFYYVEVEPRIYDNSFMHYGPIPEKEVLKFDKLVQNKGWH